jgi:hypothetical protein
MKQAMMQVAQNDITVSTEGLEATRVLNQRYAVVPDVQGILRVVSLLREKARELQPRGTHDNVSYAFSRTMHATDRKDWFGQRRLMSLTKRYGKKPTQSELEKLAQLLKFGRGHPWLEARKPVMMPSDVMGMPYLDNTQLDSTRGGWIIATVTPKGLLFGAKPKVHLDPTAAEAELERLASVSPGTEFVLLKAVKTAVTQTVQTRSFI